MPKVTLTTITHATVDPAGQFSGVAVFSDGLTYPVTFSGNPYGVDSALPDKWWIGVTTSPHNERGVFGWRELKGDRFDAMGAAAPWLAAAKRLDDARMTAATLDGVYTRTMESAAAVVMSAGAKFLDEGPALLRTLEFACSTSTSGMGAVLTLRAMIDEAKAILDAVGAAKALKTEADDGERLARLELEAVGSVEAVAA